MKDVIEKLVDMDRQAEIYNKETQNEKESLEKEIAAEKQKIYDKYMADAKIKAQKNAEQIKAESEKTFKENEEKRKILLEKLESEFNANNEKWVKNIVDNVLK